MILPFIEEQRLYDEGFAAFASGTHVNNNKAAYWMGDKRRQLPAVRCPSDKWVSLPSNRRASFCNVRKNGGDNWNMNNNATGAAGRRGPFHFPTPSHITDGLSKTVMLGEVVIGEETTDLSRGTARVASYHTSVKPLDYMAAAAAPTVLPEAGVGPPTNYLNQPGVCWMCRDVAEDSFFTVLPPNGPRCAPTHVSLDNSWHYAVIPASSAHGGGASVVMCDGSVKFITSDIDTNNLPDTVLSSVTLTSPSLYGIWGSLGTAKGGEVVGSGGL